MLSLHQSIRSRRYSSKGSSRKPGPPAQRELSTINRSCTNCSKSSLASKHCREQYSLHLDGSRSGCPHTWQQNAFHEPAYSQSASSADRAPISMISWHLGIPRMRASSPDANNWLYTLRLCRKQRRLQKRPWELSSRERYAKNERPHTMHLR
jgi:hypothetical protein